MDNHPAEGNSDSWNIFRFSCEYTPGLLDHQNSVNEKRWEHTFQFHNLVHLPEVLEEGINPNHCVGLSLHSHQATFQCHGNGDLYEPSQERQEPHLRISLASLSHQDEIQNPDTNLPMPSDEGNEPNLSQYLASCLGMRHQDGDPIEVPDVPDTCFNYINNLLREEGLDDNPGTLHDYMAFHSYQLLNDALGEVNQHPFDPCPSSLCQSARSLDENENTCYSSCCGNSCEVTGNFVEMNWTGNLSPTQFESFLDSAFHSSSGPNVLTPEIAHVGKFGQFEDNSKLTENGNCELSCAVGTMSMAGKEKMKIPEILPTKSRGRKHHQVEVDDIDEVRSNKQLASSDTDAYEQIVKYEDDLFCPEGKAKPEWCNNNGNQKSAKSKKNLKGTNIRGKKKDNKAEAVDLLDLLSHCARAISHMDLSIANELLKQIRQHSSPYGDSIQRVSHYFAHGLEARLLGIGSRINLTNAQVSDSDILKANRIYVAAVPFKIMSYYVANKTITMLAGNATCLHIIDFGISLGLQWPCIIFNLSKNDTGPPRLRITGVDFPQPGFHPAKRVEDTGRCLARYCERFNVPFEYHAIAKNWEEIKREDLHINSDELLVVNCLYRSHQLFDESVEKNCPRNVFLKLVREINPGFFIHGVVNGAFGVPLFATRFKEAVFHYSALFELFEATMPREDHERLLLESKLYGKEAMNVVGYEGTERVERPETYQRWQVRQQRAGYRQLPLDQELLKSAKAMVRKSFRREFVFDEDSHWAVQGWKGRILYAISCWKPIRG